MQTIGQLILSIATRGRSLSVAVLIGALVATGGCSRAFHREEAGTNATLQEPQLGREYFLYTPSTYDREHVWPLIVVCHGRFPDSPQSQIDEWTPLAEKQGFIVAAPRFNSGGVSIVSRPQAQIAGRREDEAQILSTVKHVRGSLNISEDRIFIAGMSSGAHAALYAGLRNPRLFRAVALARPKFDEDVVASLHRQVDPYQRVFVTYVGPDKVIHQHGRRCADWLRHAGADVRAESLRSNDKSDAERCLAFFRAVVSTEAWLHIRPAAPDSAQPLQVQFSLETSLQPRRYRWQFGDGDESPVAEPLHVYRKQGEYVVVITVDSAKGDVSRAVELSVPELKERSVAVPVNPVK